MKRGILFLLLATVLWSGNYISGRYLADMIPATLLNTIRWCFSTIILFSLLFLQKKKISLLKNWKEFLITGFFGTFAFSTLNYYSLHYIDASFAGMISAGSPIAILLFTPIVLKEKIPVRAWAGTIVSVFGVILLFQGKTSSTTADTIFGGLLMVLACCSWGLYTVFGKKYGKRIDVLTLTTGAAFYGMFFNIISWLITFDLDAVDMTPTGWLALFYSSTLASVAAFLFWNNGVDLVGTGRGAPYINFLPIWTVILGITLLNEQLSALTFIGGFITIAGALIASVPETLFKKGKWKQFDM